MLQKHAHNTEAYIAKTNSLHHVIDKASLGTNLQLLGVSHYRTYKSKSTVVVQYNAAVRFKC